MIQPRTMNCVMSKWVPALANCAGKAVPNGAPYRIGHHSRPKHLTVIEITAAARLRAPPSGRTAVSDPGCALLGAPVGR